VYPDDGLDANSLLRQADLAMYQAKQRRSGFEYLAMNEYVRQQLNLEPACARRSERTNWCWCTNPRSISHAVWTGALSAADPFRQHHRPEKFIPCEETGLISPWRWWCGRHRVDRLA